MAGGVLLVGVGLYAYKRWQDGGDKEDDVVDATEGFDDPETPGRPPTPSPP